MSRMWARLNLSEGTKTINSSLCEEKLQYNEQYKVQCVFYFFKSKQNDKERYYFVRFTCQTACYLIS